MVVCPILTRHNSLGPSQPTNVDIEAPHAEMLVNYFASAHFIHEPLKLYNESKTPGDCGRNLRPCSRSASSYPQL